MEKLQLYREQNNYSFQKMADLLNISKTFYWQIEKEHRRLSYDMAIKISNIFNLKPDELFYDYFSKKNKKTNL